MASKPIIGITKPDRKDNFAYLAVWLSVILAGGKPLKITAKNKDYTAINLDGLILGGGKDIFPARYNQAAKEDYLYDPDRDEMEVFWAERAREEHIPTLGICRGAQLLNIATGGTLYQSVAEAYENAHYPDGIIHNIFYRKRIKIFPDTLLCNVIKSDNLKVNSIHKQAIADMGADVIVNAKEDNGVIQAISLKEHPFYLGIQFHPEFLIYKKAFLNIFKALVNASKNR